MKTDFYFIGKNEPVMQPEYNGKIRRALRGCKDGIIFTFFMIGMSWFVFAISALVGII